MAIDSIFFRSPRLSDSGLGTTFINVGFPGSLTERVVWSVTYLVDFNAVLRKSENPVDVESLTQTEKYIDVAEDNWKVRNIFEP